VAVPATSACPALATGVMLVSQNSGSMIGPSVHRLSWAMGITPAFPPCSGVLPPNSTLSTHLLQHSEAQGSEKCLKIRAPVPVIQILLIPPAS